MPIMSMIRPRTVRGLELAGLDAHDLQLLGREPEGVRPQAPRGPREACVFLGDGNAVDPVAGDHEKAHGMDRHDRAGRQDGALHTLLAPLADKALDVLEARELRSESADFAPMGLRSADLRHDDADLPRRDLHQGVTGHRVQRPELDAQARHQQPRLISRLAAEGDRVAFVQGAQA